MGKSTVPLLGKIFLSKFSFSTLEIDEMIDEKNGKSNLTRANVQNWYKVWKYMKINTVF